MKKLEQVDRDIGQVITQELGRHGVEKWTVSAGGKHPKLTFDWHGDVVTVVMPKTASTHRGRGGLNARAWL